MEAFLRDKLAPLVLRTALGLVCVYHAYLKIQINGGANWYPSWPVGWQLATSWGEMVAGLAVLFGFRCRLAAAAAVGITIGTIAKVQGWNVAKLPLKTLEPTLVYLLVGFACLFLGAGGLSLDQKGAKK